MPQKMWAHSCSKYDNSTVWRGVEICSDCGMHAKYDGWHFSMIEQMAAYQKRTGLKPIGAHRALADMMFNPHMEACVRCNGKGLVDTEDGEDWKICPICGGARYLFRGSKEEFDAIRSKILLAFPDCEA